MKIASGRPEWHHAPGKKASASSSKAAKTVRKATKRKTAAQRFNDLPAAERLKRLDAYFDDVKSQWEGSPKARVVDYLVQLRREA